MDTAYLSALPSAIVVLGCRLRFDDRKLIGAAARRSHRAAEAYFARPGGALVLATGGRAWGACGAVEADVLAGDLERCGVPRAHLLRERCSHSTRENAKYAAELLRARGIETVELVTCSFHMRRAKLLFEHAGFSVIAAEATSPGTGTGTGTAVGALARLLQFGRERGAMLADARFVQRAQQGT